MMIECYRTQSGWYAVHCRSCDIETFHEDAMEAQREGLGHMEMHQVARDLNRYFGLVGASIAYSFGAHFIAGSLN